MSILNLENLTYQYQGTSKNVLKGVNESFEKGTVSTIMGRSGSGKSTLLSLITGLDVWNEGHVYNHDQDLKLINRDDYRAQQIGVIFQGYNLLMNATAIENIVLSMNTSKSKSKNKEAHALDLLSQVVIDAETARGKVIKLSGGEQQRVGIARALASNPDIIIADEPTGILDETTEQEILDLMIHLAHEMNKCVIIVTHSKEVTKNRWKDLYLTKWIAKWGKN